MGIGRVVKGTKTRVRNKTGNIGSHWEGVQVSTEVTCVKFSFAYNKHTDPKR